MDPFDQERIRDAGRAKLYELTLHADDEREQDGLTYADIDEALIACSILETYPEDKRGASCLVAGIAADGRPVHVVCALQEARPLTVITVYVPSMPKWKNPRERNR